jgi:hypothetical protein
MNNCRLCSKARLILLINTAPLPSFENPKKIAHLVFQSNKEKKVASLLIDFQKVQM